MTQAAGETVGLSMYACTVPGTCSLCVAQKNAMPCAGLTGFSLCQQTIHGFTVVQE